MMLIITNLHMPPQCSCRGIGRIRSDRIIVFWAIATRHLARFRQWAHKTFVRWAHEINNQRGRMRPCPQPTCTSECHSTQLESLWCATYLCDFNFVLKLSDEGEGVSLRKRFRRRMVRHACKIRLGPSHVKATSEASDYWLPVYHMQHVDCLTVTVWWL